jgi:recombination protein RecA
MAVSAEKQAEGRIKSVDSAISQIHRQFGNVSIMRLGVHERQNILNQFSRWTTSPTGSGP